MAKADFKGKSGNDYAVYDVGQHLRDDARYDGGSGVDTLELRMTRTQFDAARPDILRYLDFIADRTNGNGTAAGKTFEFRAFNLDVKHFEQVVVRVDGRVVDPRDQPVDAVDDAVRVRASSTLTGSVTANDSAPDAPATVTLLTAPALGSLALAADGSYTYTPGAAFASLMVGQSATQTFTYRLTDVDGDSDTATVTITIDGTARRALDGYIADATVFADTNANGALDVGEASAITGSSGEFTLEAPGTLILRGGVDIATGLPFAGELRAPEGYAVVSALTTLVSVLAGGGLTVEEAENKVLSAFAIDPAVDLATLDPIAQTLAGNASAEAAFVAGSAVLNTVTMLASTIDGERTEIDFAAAAASTFSALAGAIGGLPTGAALDLGEPGVVAAIATQAGVAEWLVEGAAAIASASNALLETAALTADGVALLGEATKISTLAQGETAQALEHAGETGDPAPALQAYTGTALGERVVDAPSGDVDGPGVHNAPIAADDALGTAGRAGITFNASALLANDVDYDGDALTVTIGTGPTHGTLTLDAGAYVYTPALGYVGSDSFTYTANDGTLLSNIATATIDVDAANHSPVATPLSPAGALDVTFGDAGKLSTPITWADHASALAITDDGRIVVAGITQDLLGNNSYFVARYTADGALDATFGTAGVVLEAAVTVEDVLEAPKPRLALADDGSVAMAVTLGEDVAVYRYTAGGQRDTAFDGDGALVTDAGGNETARAVAFDADGRILVAGSSGNAALLARYNADGTLDATLDGDGIVTWARPFTQTPIYLRSEAFANDLVIQPDGKIVLAGGSGIFERSFGIPLDLTVLRYEADGTLDTSFGENGVLLDFLGPRSGSPPSSAATAVALHENGDLAFAVTVNHRQGIINSVSRFGAARYNSDGDAIAQVITAVEPPAKPKSVIPPPSAASDIAVDDQGRLIIAGTSGNTGTLVALVRYNPDLTIDASFGNGGRFTIAGDSVTPNVRVALDTAGRIVALGGSVAGTDSDPTLVRVLPGLPQMTALENAAFTKTLSPTLFSDADGDTLAYTATLGDGSPLPAWLTFDSATLTFTGTPRQGDEGNLEVSVTASDGALTASQPLALTIVNTNDAPVVMSAPGFDPSFGENGVVSTREGGVSSADLVARHGSGTVVLGYSDIEQRAVVARYDAAGHLDPDFAVFPTFDNGQVWLSLAVQPDGGVITGGRAVGVNEGWDIALERRNADGSRDLAFGGGDGLATADFSFDETARVLATHADGSIVVAGTYNDGSDHAIVERFDAQGELDLAFNGGYAPLALAGSVRPVALALYDDGRILVGLDVDTTSFALARLDADGSIDTSFGDNGIVAGAFGDFASLSRVLIASDGDVIAAVTVGIGDVHTPTLLRYDASGALDTSFSVDGVASAEGRGFIGGAVIRDDGSVVVAAEPVAGSEPIVVLRFDTQGAVTADLTAAVIDHIITGLLLLDDGAVLAAGSASEDGGSISTVMFARAILDVDFPDATLHAGDLFTATVPSGLFADPDRDALTYDAVLSAGGALPDWLSFDPSTRTFSGTPDTEDVGAFDIAVRATDPFGLFASERFVVEVMI